MDFDLIIVGNIALDINTFPGRDNSADLIVTNIGGAGYYSLLPASLFSSRVGLVARVGCDFPANKIGELGVDLSGFKVIDQSKTTRFYHTYLTADGQQRTFRPEFAPDTLIRPDDFPVEYYRSKFIHIATNFPFTQIEFIEILRKNTDAKLSIDTHEAYLGDYRQDVFRAFDLVDIAFIDRHEEELIQACKAPTKIIKRGKDGITYLSKTNKYDWPAIPCDVVDKTGAGDVLAGVFLTLQARGWNLQESAQKAVEVASASVRDYGVEFLSRLYPHRRDH